MFGFTGTPIFAENASKNDLGKRTTADLFGNCLHKYVITDAIRDENVLKFSIEYYSVFKHKNKPQFDEMVEDINKEEVFNDPQYIESVADYIIANHNRKTFNKDYSALFVVSSIDAAINYYLGVGFSIPTLLNYSRIRLKNLTPRKGLGMFPHLKFIVTQQYRQM